MANQNYSLVIVVGAGASKEAGLPTGYELKDRIAMALNTRPERAHRRNSGSEIVEEALWQICQKRADRQQQNINSYHHACQTIANAMPQAASIDNFIDAHRDNSEIVICGKLAIAHCILKAESESTLRVNNQNINNTINFQDLEKTWYSSFFRLIVEGYQLDDISTRLTRIAIISFNYDRCIEHYLHQSLQNYYRIQPAGATELLKNLKIYHPYGYLGPLPWTIENFGTVSFGGIPNTDQLISIANGLKTFTEGTDPEHSDIIEIRSTIRSSERVVFLGFAFGEQNLELLYGNNNSQRTEKRLPIYATAFGLSISNTQSIKNELYSISGHQLSSIHIHNDLTCFQLIDEYSRSLKIR